jgi:hypothetical protein
LSSDACGGGGNEDKSAQANEMGTPKAKDSYFAQLRVTIHLRIRPYSLHMRMVHFFV